MRTIYKYDLSDAKDNIIEGPIVRLLHAGQQHGRVMVWAEVDTSLPMRQFEVFPIGTGWDLTLEKNCVLDTHTYLNTVQLFNGSYIFHVYYKDVTPKKVKLEIKDERVRKIDLNKSKKAEISATGMINVDVLKKFFE